MPHHTYFRAANHKRSPRMRCPLDNSELVMSDRQGIEIDYCPKCRGVWLDRGELDKIIERSADDLAPPPRTVSRDDRSHEDRYRDDRRHDRDDDYRYERKPYKKKKSLLGEIFDF